MNKGTDPIQNMMLNIVEEGEEKIFLDIELIKRPLERIKQKGLYYEAIKKLRKGK